MNKLDSSEGIVFVNGRDHAAEYVEHVGNNLPDGWQMILHTENLGALGAMNYVFREYPDEPFYGFIGDDEYVYTKDWNKHLTQAAGLRNISHANDGWQSGQRIHSFVCIGGELVRAVGYMAVPECWHWYGFDTMWEMISKQLPLRNYLANIETEHRHPLKHKVATDDCYSLGESKQEEDEKAFRVWVNEEMPEALKRIKKIV